MQPEKAELPKVDEDSDLSHSLMDSIKTSIDEETLMELAKKGITAPTPVYKKRSTLQPQSRSPTGKPLEVDSNTVQRLTDAVDHSLNNKTPGESHGSLGRVNMKSTLKEQQSAEKITVMRRSLQNRPVSKSDITVTI